jgi:hypothetical protein
VSGIVTDAAGGAPLANAKLMLRHDTTDLITRTDANGSYAFSFQIRGPYPNRVVPEDILGLLAVVDGTDWGDTSRGHWTAVHPLPWGPTDIVHNVRLRPVRTVLAGQSMAMSIDADSSLEWNTEWDPTFVTFDTLWEEFRVSVHTDGVLTINLRSDGDTIPSLICQYGGCPGFRVDGPVSIPVHAGMLYFAVDTPRRSAPQRFDVQTSLR